MKRNWSLIIFLSLMMAAGGISGWILAMAVEAALGFK
jgi:hypothetical protein